MTLVTSHDFASASATGNDWREVCCRLLEQLEPLRQQKEPYNLGFLYVTDFLSLDVENILNLIRSVTGVENWVGATGLGICASGESFVDIPAASVMLARFPEQAFQIFPATDLTLSGARESIEPWMEKRDPMLTLVHGDPMATAEPMQVMAELERLTGGFLAGGLCSSRREHVLISGQPQQGGIGGVVFSSDVPVVSALTQGCAPLGIIHTITGVNGDVIETLDGLPAFEVFTEDLKAMALAMTDHNPACEKIREAIIHDDMSGLEDDVISLFRGEVHVAFPVTGSDQRDYMVRNIAGLDPDTGWMALAHPVELGQQIVFVHRDDRTVRADLTRALSDLRERVIRDQGKFAPKGAVYISCVARAMADFGVKGGEMQILKDILGDVPLAGFYANGEISNRRLYGYSGVLLVFL